MSSSTETPPSPFTPNQSIRKSFSKAERPVSLKNRSLDVKTIEESTSGTDPEEESSAEVTNVTDYNEIFKGRGCESFFLFIILPWVKEQLLRLTQ